MEVLYDKNNFHLHISIRHNICLHLKHQISLIDFWNVFEPDFAQLEVEVDTSEYDPGELQVTVEGGTVRVVGRHQEKDKVSKFIYNYRLSVRRMGKWSKSFTLIRVLPCHHPQKEKRWALEEKGEKKLISIIYQIYSSSMLLKLISWFSHIPQYIAYNLN